MENEDFEGWEFFEFDKFKKYEYEQEIIDSFKDNFSKKTHSVLPSEEKKVGRFDPEILLEQVLAFSKHVSGNVTRKDQENAINEFAEELLLKAIVPAFFERAENTKTQHPVLNDTVLKSKISIYDLACAISEFIEEKNS